MVYKNLIPQPTDSPATQSQADILENFTQLDSQFGTAGDHVAFTAGADNGMHKQVSLNNVIADPGLADPQASIYLKTVGLDSELFFENFNNTTALNVVRQMTNLTVTTVGTNHGVTTASGLILNWGTGTCAAGVLTVTFAVPYTAGTAAFPVVSAYANSAANNNAAVDNVTPPTNTQFVARTTQAAGSFYYYAIGV